MDQWCCISVFHRRSNGYARNPGKNNTSKSSKDLEKSELKTTAEKFRVKSNVTVDKIWNKLHICIYSKNKEYMKKGFKR